MNWLLRRLLALWVRYTTRPEDPAARLRDRANPICYVLERRDITDLAVLQNACDRLKLPRPHKTLLPQSKDSSSFFYLSKPLGLLDRRVDRRPPALLTELIATLHAKPGLDIDLVPVAVYWGRAPQKEVSWFRLLLVEEWPLTSRVRKFFQVLFNGRATLIEIEDPRSLRSLLGGEGDIALQARRVARVLRAGYRQRRTARIGPDLSHRRTLVTSVLRTGAVRAAIAQEMREKKISRREAMQRAQAIVDEIAANYSHAFVRFMYRLLTRVWNRLYDGVVFEHADTLERVAEGHELIYVPCHRSHMDYLLLSYAIYRQGYAIPHIAAGINLNMPIIGRFLRKGGAFFMRRSFRGSALYAVVFMSYLGAIMSRGYPIEYFIEGGRSRTGRLLQPKTGMLAMTVRSYLREPRRPVVFIPVYFGYERIVEGNTYIGELSGKPKEKESIGGFLRALKRLRERFGHVYVNVGEPISLDELLDARRPAQARTGAIQEASAFESGPRGGEARPRDDEGKDNNGEIDKRTLSAVVEDLAQRIMVNVNAAAAVTPINLLALALLAAPRQSMPETDLLRQVDMYLALLNSFPYSARVTVTPLAAADILKYGETMKAISRERHPLGDLVRMSEETAVLATYYRNNVLHLFAMPSLIACAFDGNPTLRIEDIQRLAGRIYPYVASELFLRWREDELPQVVEGVLEALADRGLVEPDRERGLWHRPPPSSAQAMQLSLLAQTTIQTVERYYLAVALLLKAGSGSITQAALEQQCHLMAQRITLLYGFNSPEFFDRSLFTNFIDLLRSRNVLRVSREGRLEFDDVLLRVAEDAQLVLSEQIRHSILQVTHA